MRNLVMIILVLSCGAWAITPFSYFWTVKTTGDTATVTKWRNNNDSVLNWASRVSDTINYVVPRWNWFSNHDSTFKWMNIDTIKGPVRIDTVYSDSIYTTRIKSVRVTSDSATIPILTGSVSVRGVAVVDSFNSTKGTGLMICDSAKINANYFNLHSGSAACTLWIDTAGSVDFDKHVGVAGTLFYYKTGHSITVSWKTAIVSSYAGTIISHFISCPSLYSYCANVGYQYLPVAAQITGSQAVGFLGLYPSSGQFYFQVLSTTGTQVTTNSSGVKVTSISFDTYN